jgi:ribonuclease Z
LRPSFHPRLINDPFSDPGLFIPFLFEKRALIFDLGDLGGLSPRDLLKVSHAFVTHAHMDHFIGFDTLLRVFLGRSKRLHLYGPPGFFDHVEGRLSGYAWNLVAEYEDELVLEVNEVHASQLRTKTYFCRKEFSAQGGVRSRPFDGVLLDEASFSVHGTLLDHRIPCLGLALTERFYVNILKEGLKALGLPVGPWLNGFKEAVYRETDPDTNFFVTLQEKGGVLRQEEFLFGELTRKIARISPGQKITYITDVAGHEANRTKMVDLARKSNLLFIEAPFLESEMEAARRKYHLTARDAGEIARDAEVSAFRLFHFSPRYKGREAEFEKEAREAFTRPR